MITKITDFPIYQNGKDVFGLFVEFTYAKQGKFYEYTAK